MSDGWVLMDVEGNAGTVTIDLGKLSAPDRLALARALVADMPGVVVGRDVGPFPYDFVGKVGWAQAYDAWTECRAAMLANGEKKT